MPDSIIPGNSAAAAAYMDAWRQANPGPDRAKAIVLGALIKVARETHQTLTPEELAPIVVQFNREFDKAIAGHSNWSYNLGQAIQRGLETLTQIPETSALVSPAIALGVWNYLNDIGPFELLGHSRDAQQRTAEAAALEQYGWWERTHFLEQDVLKFATATAAGAKAGDADDAAAVKMWDFVFAPKVNVSVTESSITEVAAKAPKVTIPFVVLRSVQPDGKVLANVVDLKNEVQTQFNDIKTIMSQGQSYLVQLDAGQKELLKWKAESEARRKQQEESANQAAALKLRLDVAASGVNVLSTLVGWIDPKVGKDINVFGAATINIASSVINYINTASHITDTLEKGLQGALLTGNILGAVMSVASLFISSGPTPEQLILEGINDLKKQLNDLGKAMEDRFDRLDKRLNAAFTEMNSQLTRINTTLGRIEGGVYELQQNLLSLQASLNRLDGNVQVFVSAAARQALITAANGALGYRDTYGADMDYQRDFVPFENVFHSWATQHSFDELIAGPSNRPDADDAAVFDELRKYPLPVNVNYLATALDKRGLPTFSRARLPNPSDWAFSSKLYASLIAEWPQFAVRLAPERQQALSDVGQTLSTALKGITVDPVSGAANTALFQGLIANYNRDGVELDNAIELEEGQFLREQQQLEGLPPGRKLDLWGGLDQSTQYADIPSTVQPQGWAAPKNVGQFIPSAFLLADYLKVPPSDQQPRVHIGVNAAWTDEEYPTNPRLKGIMARRHVILEMYYDTVVITRLSFTDPTREPAGTVDEGLAIDPMRFMDEKWSHYLTIFEQNPQQDQLTDTEKAQRDNTLQGTSQAVNGKLEAYQRAFYARLATRLKSAGVPVRQALEALSGGKLLLQSIVELGLPRALEADEYLRSFFFGSLSLLDEDSVYGIYAGANQSSSFDRTRNLRAILAQLRQQQTTDLYTAIAGYLSQVASQAYEETHPQVESALTQISTLTTIISESRSATPAIRADNGVVNGATFQSDICPQSWITIFGTNLARSTRVWTSDDLAGGNLPVQLDGVSVSVNNKPAYIQYISPTQINAISPADDTLGRVEIVVHAPGGTSRPATTSLTSVSPGLFTFDGKFVAATHGDGKLLARAGFFASAPEATTPAQAGEIVVLYGSGFGETNPPINPGRITDTVANIAAPFSITIGGAPATVAFGGLIPSFARLFQLNVRIPDNLPSGDHPIIIEMGGRRWSGPTGGCYISVTA